MIEKSEEAGVLGKIWGNEIGEYRYKKGTALCRVKGYPLDVSKVLEKWPEKFKNFQPNKPPERSLRVKGMVL